MLLSVFRLSSLVFLLTARRDARFEVSICPEGPHMRGEVKTSRDRRRDGAFAVSLFFLYSCSAKPDNCAGRGDDAYGVPPCW